MEELTVKIGDVESLIDEVAETAYEKAVEVVTDKVREQTQLADMEVVEKYRKSVTSPTTKNSPEMVRLANTLFDRVQEKLRESAGRVLKQVRAALHKPEVKQEGKKQVKEKARESVRERLKRAQEEQADGDVIDFAARLYGLPGLEAAKKLAADFGISYDSRGRASPKPARRSVSAELRFLQAERKWRL